MCSSYPIRVLLIALLLLGSSTGAAADVRHAGPGNYLDELRRLQPGDTLALRSGSYPHGLPVHNLAGTPGDPIHIAGPTAGAPAVIHPPEGGNVVSIVDSSWVTIRGLVLDGNNRFADAVKAEGHARFAHHITLSDLEIRNLRRHQQIVGISTKCPATGWVIRNNVIRDAGTGLYLGDSDGSAPFVDGLIEHNLVTGSIGYAMQIKHQEERPADAGLPKSPSVTVIRHNVFAKDARSATEQYARPNVLLGHFPVTGPGSMDRYAVYGNLFHNNPTERLFQAEGNVALYSNLFVNPEGDAIAIMPHKGDPRRIAIFHNTILARDTGIRFHKSEKTERALVRGNAVFAGEPFSGDGAGPDGNVADEYGRADQYLRKPFAGPGALDLTPVDGRLSRSVALPPEVLRDLPEVRTDFDGLDRTGERIGAYDGRGGQPKWVPALAIKPIPSRKGSAAE